MVFEAEKNAEKMDLPSFIFLYLPKRKAFHAHFKPWVNP
jgi:hypothetical protein